MYLYIVFGVLPEACVAVKAPVLVKEERLPQGVCVVAMPPAGVPGSHQELCPLAGLYRNIGYTAVDQYEINLLRCTWLIRVRKGWERAICL